MQQEKKPSALEVTRCGDFTPDGTGRSEEWARTEWIALKKLPGGDLQYASRFKILYSSEGIYVLFEGEDHKITSEYLEDQSDMYKADVFEVFLHPDPGYPIYFEYEVNALDRELVLLIPNINGRFFGWQPWHYEGTRTIKKAVKIQGGPQKPFAAIRTWTAELFFPYEVLNPIMPKKPGPGDVWRANFYRLDYDAGIPEKWSWMPVGESFHEFEKFGRLMFK